ncbi:ABC transporter substrate-binding protein [Bradyrhizobium yuanmingense]|uniref:ABC transporter substrate-binding protein n=1 Tax=Bradyrhizobium yuanmingense TaxID=108015 RepID=UPI0023B9AD24|nr:ABC transporter substrate-binding protein [Bradyrhizobium yuanmingense]MDF0518799.1 ABC transporter substrate-binding protein [Bradyrhizobium yuanmingense]
MQRRSFIKQLVATAAMGQPMFSHAQPSVRQRRIAIAIPGRNWGEEIRDNPYHTAFMDELARLGFVEGRNLTVDRYGVSGEIDAYPELARSVVKGRPEVVLTATIPMTSALKAATSAIPLVTIIGDPIAAGLASSLARPGANITGITVDAGIELWGKRLSLLMEIKPGAARLAYLSSSSALKQPQAAIVERSALALNLSLLRIDLGSTLSESAYETAISPLQNAQADLLLVSDEPQHISNGGILARVVTKAQVPAMYPFRDIVVAGGLMAYYRDLVQALGQAAAQVGEILKGTNPAEMPFRQPTSFKLSINTNAARSIGLVVPPKLLAIADDVIE